MSFLTCSNVFTVVAMVAGFHSSSEQSLYMTSNRQDLSCVMRSWFVGEEET
jgi:hypothetical protein